MIPTTKHLKRGEEERTVTSQTEEYTESKDGNVLVCRLKRRHRMAWYATLAFFIFHGVLAVLSNSGFGHPVFKIADTSIFLLANLTLLYALQLGSRIRVAKPQSYWRMLVGQVLPPLLLLPLFVMPWDVTGLFYWIVGGFAAFVSLLNLLFNHPMGWRANLRRLLTLAIFVAAVAMGFVVEATTNRYAQTLASRLQGACKERGRCLSAPEGWRVEGRLARSGYGHWTFTYLTNSDQTEFGLWVHMRNEVEKCIQGGVTIQLSEVRSLFCNSEAPSSNWK